MKPTAYNQPFLSTVLAAGALMASAAVSAEQPELLQAALTPPERQPFYRYTVFTKEDDFEGVASIDPSQPSGQRVTLISSTMASDDPELLALLAAADAEPMSDFWCHDMADMVPESVTEVDRSEGAVTYQFAPDPGEDASADDTVFMQNLTGELRIDEHTGTVRSFRLFAHKTFRISLAVKVKFFEMNAVCEPVATGGSRLVESTTRVEARALFKRLEQLEIKRITDVELIE